MGKALQVMDSYKFEWFLTSKEHADVTILTDASLKLGIGGHCDEIGDYFHRPYTSAESDFSVPAKEMLAISHALHRWGHRWGGQTVLVRTDSNTCVGALRKRYSPKGDLMTLIRKIALHEAEH